MAWFQILSVAVVCGMILSVSGQQVFKTKLTYEAAKASCESMGLRMAVDFSAAKHDALKHAADESAGFQLIKSDYWINGRVGSDDVVTTNEGRRLINYQKWNIGEPSGNGDCLQLWGLAGHNWDDDNCGHEKYYICEHEAADDYIVFADDESQEDARKECNQYGLVLAKDTSNKVHNAILNVVRNSEANGGDVWIDGRRGSDDIVETSDGDRLTKYHPWAAGEPTGNDVCLQLWSSRDYDWDDDSCNNKDSFVCQQPEKRLTVYIDQQSHDDALATCVGVGMVLAKDDSDEKHQTLIDAIKDSPADGKDVWIDGIRGSDNIVVTTDGQRMTDYHPWAWLEPLRNGVCIQLWDWRDYDWDDDSCLNTDPFICEPAAQKLTVFDVPKTRDQAIEACKALGMVLAKDDSDAKHQILVDAVEASTADGSDVWIDGNRGSDNIVTTSDGERLTDHHPWSWLEPSGNGKCIQLWAARSYDWDDDDCGKTDAFICEPAEVEPTEPPPTEAPPTEAPPTEAPPTEAPPTEAPPPEDATTNIPTLAPCEYPVPINNVAQDKTASQSSDKPKKDAFASLAVDGNKDSDLKAGKSCSWTDKEFQPWWKVDLGSSYDIYEVVITNRQDCCTHRIKNAQIRVGDSENFEDNPVCGMMVLGKMSREETIKIRCGCEVPMPGRYVSIQLIDKEQMLTLCEVEVMAG